MSKTLRVATHPDFVTKDVADLPANRLTAQEVDDNFIALWDRKPSFFVAASDADQVDKDLADYVCTGTDDHLVIQQAISDLPASGGKVQLSTGTFNGHVRVLKANTALVGSGWNTIIKIQAGAVLKDSDCPVRLLADDCYVGHLTVDGNRDAQTHLGDWESNIGLVREFDGVGIYANRCIVDTVKAQQCLGHHIILWSDPFELESIAGGARHGCIVQNCWIMDRGGRNTLDFASTWELGANYDENINYGNIIRGCVCLNGANILIHTGWDTTIENCLVMGGGNISYHTNSRRVAIRGNRVVDPTASGIAMYGGLSTAGSETRRRSRNCVVENNYVVNSATSGIYASRQTDAIIRNNIVLNPTTSGILYEQCEGLTIEYNDVKNTGSHSINQTGTTEELRCHNIRIIGNRITGATGTTYGIFPTRTTTLIIKDNHIRNGDRGINMQSVDTSFVLIDGNYIENDTNQAIVITNITTGPHIRNNVFKSPAATTVATLQTLSNMIVEGNSFLQGSTAISLNGSVTNARILNNYIDVTGAGKINNVQSDTITRNNSGYITEASGSATIADTTTHIDVTHGLTRTPTSANIVVTPTNNLGNATKFWISDVGSSTFRINVDADPGATTATFTWRASF